MRLAITQGLQAALLLSGFAALFVAGVKLHIDTRLEQFFIDVDPNADRSVLRLVGDVANDLGYEVMDEWESPAQELDNGAIRLWMAEKEVVHDRSFDQAV